MQPDELKALRKALHWTQGQMADALGMSQWSVTQMENGKAPIERRTALAALYLTEHPEAAASDV